MVKFNYYGSGWSYVRIVYKGCRQMCALLIIKPGLVTAYCGSNIPAFISTETIFVLNRNSSNASLHWYLWYNHGRNSHHIGPVCMLSALTITELNCDFFTHSNMLTNLLNTLSQSTVY